MPIEQLMERYGGHVPSASIKVLRKKEDFKSPAIKAKKNSPGLIESAEGGSQSCDQTNDSNEVTDSVKTKLEDQLVNGHSNNAAACVHSSETKADSSSDNDGVDSTSEDKPANKGSKHAVSKGARVGSSNEAEAIHAQSDSSEQSGVGSSSNGKHSSGDVKAVSGEAEVSGGCSSTAGEGGSSNPPKEEAGGSEAVPADCTSSGDAAGSSSQQVGQGNHFSNQTSAKKHRYVKHITYECNS